MALAEPWPRAQRSAVVDGRAGQSVAETEALFTTHPDDADAPDTDPARDTDADAADDAILEAERDELADEFDD